ncbi:MAG: hypothetical protein K2L14_07635 [Duncaniella sp.]|nr:hypothetical protein [Duncaniella sp.]
MRLWKYIGEFLTFRWLVGLLEHKPERKSKTLGGFFQADDEVADQWVDSAEYDGDCDMYGCEDSSDFFHEEQEDFDSFDF